MAKLTLMMDNRKPKTFTQEFIPFRKKVDYTKKERDILKIKDKGEQQDKLIEYQLQFVADLFEYDEVTPDAILDGLDCNDSNTVAEIIFHDVLGIPRIDDEEAKNSDDPKE